MDVMNNWENALETEKMECHLILLFSLQINILIDVLVMPTLEGIKF